MSLSVSLNKHFDKLFKEVRIASQLGFDLEPYMKSIDSRLGNIEKVLTEKGIQVVNQSSHSSRIDTRFSMDDEMYIPDSFRDDFDGKINKEETSTQSSTESAADALRRLRNKNKEKK